MCTPDCLCFPIPYNTIVQACNICPESQVAACLQIDGAHMNITSIITDHSHIITAPDQTALARMELGFDQEKVKGKGSSVQFPAFGPTDQNLILARNLRSICS